MKKIIFLLVLVGSVLVISCNIKTPEYSADSCLTKEQQLALLQGMVRYSSKLAPEATNDTKFNTEFNWYYDKAVAECNILYCLLNDQDSTYQLLIAREARSITPMQEGIALKIKFNQRKEFDYYEEVFRTWKMPADTLRKRGEFLFKQMVTRGDLTLYYSKFQKDKFIEFPDDRFTFDVQDRKWRDSELDSLQIN